MKLIVNEKDGCCESIHIEYTPTEALIINQAMLRYVNDEEVNEENRTIMEQMLEVEPIFVEQEPKTDVLDKIIAEIYEEFMTVDGGVHDKSAKKCMQIIDKYKAESEDAISREWLKIAIHNFYHGLKHTPTEEDIQAYIDAAPPVTPSLKMGRWIAYEVRLPDRTILNYRCSVCGRKLIGYSTETLSEAPFCHCGAKMVEPQERSDKE